MQEKTLCAAPEEGRNLPGAGPCKTHGPGRIGTQGKPLRRPPERPGQSFRLFVEGGSLLDGPHGGNGVFRSVVAGQNALDLRHDSILEFGAVEVEAHEDERSGAHFSSNGDHSIGQNDLILGHGSDDGDSAAGVLDQLEVLAFKQPVEEDLQSFLLSRRAVRVLGDAECVLGRGGDVRELAGSAERGQGSRAVFQAAEDHAAVPVARRGTSRPDRQTCR